MVKEKQGKKVEGRGAGMTKKKVKQVLLKDHSGGEEENKNKSGIYCLTNKSTPPRRSAPNHGHGGERSDFYIGQSSNLSARFRNYYNVSYLASKGNLIICRALIKYGYSNFSSPPPPFFPAPPPSHLPYILDLNKINII